MPKQKNNSHSGIRGHQLSLRFDEFIDLPYDLKNMTIYDYILEGIKEAQLKGIDYSDLWIDKKMIDLKQPTTVRIGETISVSFLSSKARISFLPIKPWQLKLNFLRKDAFFVFVLNQRPSGTGSYFDLIEFPSAQQQSAAPILPKTDLYLYLSGNAPEGEVEETLFNAYGVTIVKKFDVSNADTLLNLRLKIFNQTPTATNTILVVQIMEAIITDKAKSGLLDSFLAGAGEKALDRFEKLKNLALGTNQFEERKVALTRCHETFKKLVGEEEKK